ncbi:MAG TPA: hypothetical protein VN982_01720 [Candidatus Dormibacteraeota bacterium]|nr:hypothetical protein [Candidatus Dormibacteraeota bacterium]
MLVKFQRPMSEEERTRLHIDAMWLLFLRTPARATGPGEPIDLGEIGAAPERNWSKATPYSPATAKLQEPTDKRRE